MAPIGARMNPYKATNPNNFIAKAGNKPAIVATPPAVIVTQKVDILGIMA